MARRATPPDVRFWSKVDRTEGCWFWTAGLHRNGYGDFWDGARSIKAHRFAYEVSVGPVPDGMVLDHLCRVRHCVNPAHLEVVTQGENIRRGVSPFAQRARQTHCKRGHEFTPENTILRPKGRGCRQCHADWWHARWERRLAERQQA